MACLLHLLSVAVISRLNGDIETTSASSSNYMKLNGRYQELNCKQNQYKEISTQMKDKLKFELARLT